MFLKDSKTQGMQYSKILILLCLFLSVIGIGVTIWASAVFFLAESVACAIVGVCGSLAITAVVWMLKKSQAENTMKIYIAAYEKISHPNTQETIEQSEEDAFLMQQQMKEKLLNGMNNVIDVALAEATSPIERHDV